jgi:hypothetical protein
LLREPDRIATRKKKEKKKTNFVFFLHFHAAGCLPGLKIGS